VLACAEAKMLSGSGWLDPDVERDMLVRLKAQGSREEARKVARGAIVTPPPPGQEKRRR
jgi:chorismate mutase